jgi:transposase
MVLTDAQWAVLEPLESCWPHAKVSPRQLRRTISAILWQHAKGTKWCSVPPKLGPLGSHRVAPALRDRWSALPIMVDGGVDVHPLVARLGATELGSGAWPFSWRLWHQSLRDRRWRGRAITFRLVPSQAHELPQAVSLLQRLPGVPCWLVADRGCTSHAFREHVWDLGAKPAIPPQRHEAPVACPSWIYHHRNRVERLWARLKEWRPVAARYENTAAPSWVSSASPPRSTGSDANGP